MSNNLTETELELLETAASQDYVLGEALFALFREERTVNLLAVTVGEQVEFFEDVDEAVDFYDHMTDEHNANPDIFKIPVYFGSWSKYEPDGSSPQA